MPRATNPAHGARAGFTLVEMTVVLVIIGLMLTIAATRLDNAIPEYAFRADARGIARAMELGWNLALSDGKTYAVQYDIEKGRYRLLAPRTLDESEVGAASPTPAPSIDEDDPAKGREVVIDEPLSEGTRFMDVYNAWGKKVSASVVTINFDASGFASGHTVNITNEAEAVMAIRLNRLTGVAEILDEYTQAKELPEYDGR